MKRAMWTILTILAVFAVLGRIGNVFTHPTHFWTEALKVFPLSSAENFGYDVESLLEDFLIFAVVRHYWKRSDKPREINVRSSSVSDHEQQ